MVWPRASDCSTGSLSASVKLQPNVPVRLTLLWPSVIGVSAKLPILAALGPVASAKPGRSAAASVDFSTKVAVCVSVRSTSWKATVPEVVSVAASSSVTAPVGVVDPATITGWSLVPVTVTVTCRVSEARWESVSVTL